MTQQNTHVFISALLSQNENLELTKSDKELLESAYEFGTKKHAGQKRASGEGYFSGHCIPVALKIAHLGFGVNIIIAGMLHDTIEDTDTTYEELADTFSEEVASLVEGVSKLGKLKYQGNDRHIESLRKFFLAIAKNPNVIVIKLCDRWHNLETLHYLPKEKQMRIARESILIHAQLASRLGMGQLVNVLSNLAFPYAYPDEYRKTKSFQESRLKDESETIKKLHRSLLGLTTPLLGYQPLVDQRVKGTYSLYKKLIRKEWNIDDIYDLIAFRVIVEKTPDCYLVLGAVHGHWRPVPGRVKDYIALPKPNGYQSLHTAIFSGSGPIVEIQVRTKNMHAYNEYGIASHHAYKLSQEGALTPQSLEWLRSLGDFQETHDKGNGYFDDLTAGFFSDRVFVLTPKGDVIDLPKGATVLDFAYSLHSDIGDRANGGKVDGKFVALKTELHSEQIVNIQTATRTKPSQKWLEWVVTTHAKNRIKRRVNKEA